MSLADSVHSKTQAITIDGSPLCIAQVGSIAHGHQSVTLSGDDAIEKKMDQSVALVDQAVAEGWSIYGVTTGFGGMANVPVPLEMAAASQNNLLSFLATGAGASIDVRHTRAAMALRSNVLMQGCSGVRKSLVQRIVDFLNHDAIPEVNELGSIGASGDLVPLSTIARSITGHDPDAQVKFGDQTVRCTEVLKTLEMAPIDLRPKEGLALVNGTSFSAAIAANCVYEMKPLIALSLAVNAMMMKALSAQTQPFDPFVHQHKPHPGQVWTAKQMQRLLQSSTGDDSTNAQTNGVSNGIDSGDVDKALLNNGAANGFDFNGQTNSQPLSQPLSHARGENHGETHPRQVQDRYSIRCFPQYFGPVVEGLRRIEHTVVTEMNAVSDNPLIATEEGRFYQSGNFLGQYVGIAMDDLRKMIGLTAKHLDVQIATLVSPEFNQGLPASLRGNDHVPYNMGLKGLQITGNSIQPLLGWYGNPIVDHFPTHAEQFNQNINGLSWSSANLAWKSIELFQHYLCVSLIFAVQAIDLRCVKIHGHADGRKLLDGELADLYQSVYQCVDKSPSEKPFLFDDADQALSGYLKRLFSNLTSDNSICDSVHPLTTALDQFVSNEGLSS